jgi:hypothetical protein
VSATLGGDALWGIWGIKKQQKFPLSNLFWEQASGTYTNCETRGIPIETI